MSPSKSKVALPDALETPLYTLSDVTRYLQIPASTAFMLRGVGPPDIEWFLPNNGRRWPLPFSTDLGILPALDSKFPRFSFQDLAYLFIQSSVLDIFKHLRNEHGVLVETWSALHRDLLIEYGFARKNTQSFSEHKKNLLDIVSNLVKRLPGAIVEKPKANAHLYISRVEAPESLAERLYPFSRDPQPDVPRFIVIDPNKRLGQPIIADKGVPTEILWERFSAGDSVVTLSDDYDIDSEQVEEAIRYQSRMLSYWPAELLT